VNQGAAVGRAAFEQQDAAGGIGRQLLAQRADIVLVFAGLPEKAESEGFDRTSLDMPASHNALIAAVAEVNPATVVVLSNGAPVTMPWLPQVNAVLECYLGGQAWGGAVADLLTGKVSPSGKLAETFPASLEAEPCRANFPGGTHSVAYAESVYVGYRYYDTADRAVLFPFGHGLSYSRFVYSDLRVEAPPGSTAPDANAPMRVTLGLRNVGAVPASEVVQLYVHDRVSSVFRPTKELKGFAKVHLAPGQSTTVTLWLDRRAFAFWDSGAGAWAVEAGEFDILVGASSADIRLRAAVRFDHGDVLSTWATTLADRVPEYFRPATTPFSDRSPEGPFARLLGRALPAHDVDPGAEHTPNSTLRDIRSAWVGRVLVWGAQREGRKVVGADGDAETLNMMDAILLDMPLRSLGLMSQGKLSERAVDGLVHLINGHWIEGLRCLFVPLQISEKIARQA
jgi:beta-glucosidase